MQIGAVKNIIHDVDETKIGRLVSYRAAYQVSIELHAGIHPKSKRARKTLSATTLCSVVWCHGKAIKISKPEARLYSN